jgi:hypothetical protein
VLVGSGIRIETAQQLAGIGLSEEYPPNGEYYLANDIDLSVLWEEDPENSQETPPASQTPYVWRSIGSTCRECGGPLLSANTTTHVLPIRCENRDCTLFEAAQQPFSGILHGDGHTIAGLKLPGETNTGVYKEAAYLGLFGYVNSAYIHDLTLKLANTAEERAAYNGTAVSATSAIGGLAAFTRGTRIENITLKAGTDDGSAGFYATAALPSSSHTTYMGGVVGNGYNTPVRNITSSVLWNIDGPGSLTAGGIANTSEIINAKVTEDITVTASGLTVMVAGIGSASTIKDCRVNLDELTLTTSGNNGNATLAGIGSGTITDCEVDIRLIKIASTDTGGRGFNAGGLAAASGQGGVIQNSIERCSVRFDRLEVTADADTPWASCAIGGLVSRLAGTTGMAVTDCTVEGGEIVVNLPNDSDGVLMVGGLAGGGNILRSGIAGPLKITITAGGKGGVNAGGLTGYGAAQYSFIGTKGSHAELNVKKTSAHLDTAGYNFRIGGISGEATLKAAFPFQYNYAFCDVTLETYSATKSANFGAGYCVGGLAGFVPWEQTATVFTESYAVGSVTLINNYAGNESDVKFYAGGIVGLVEDDTESGGFTLSKCAALNTAVVISGSNTAASKNWRRIANPEGTMTFSNNIATVTQTPPDGYSADVGLDKKDGLLIDAPLTADHFFGTGENQLGWNTEVWAPELASGYPVFK